MTSLENAVSQLKAIAVELQHAAEEQRRTRQKMLAGNDNKKKLTPREVARIRELKNSGWKQRDIADAFDINHGTVSRIVRGIYHAKK